MIIKQVEYRTLRNLGNYEHEVVGAVAEVGMEETADEALGKLREWVAERHLQCAQAAEWRMDLHDAEERLRRLNFDIERQTKRWEKIQEFMKNLGLKIPVADDDIPF